MDLDFSHKDLQQLISSVFIPLIDEKIKASSTALPFSYPAKVTSTSSNGLTADVQLLAASSNTEILNDVQNKTGTILHEGDEVTISSPSGNWSSIRIDDNKFCYTTDGQNIAVNSIQADSIVAKSITADQIQANSISANEIMANTITANQIKTGTITANEINTSSLSATYAHITNGVIDNATIDVAKINNLSATYATITNLNSVSANINNLKASVGNIMDLTTNTLKSNIIDTAQLKAGCITADSGIIGTSAIGTTQIADGSITDGKIVTLTANKLTAGTIDASSIKVVNLDCANLTVGTINGKQIAPGAITATQLANNAVGTSQLTTDINNTIQTAYSASQTASQNAQTALTTANGKNTVYYGSTTPSNPANGDLWMQSVSGGISPMQYNGSSWVSVTDVAVANAQTASTNAQNTANNAQISATNALNTANNIQIGGVNLLLNSCFSKGNSSSWNYFTNNGGTASIVPDSSSPTGYAVSGTGHAGYWYPYGGITVPFVSGQQYTMSVMAKGSGTFTLGYEASGGICQFTLTSTYQKYSYTFTCTPSYNLHIYGDNGSTFNFHSAKLETGNKVTDWCPSLVDTQSQIDSTVNNIQTINTVTIPNTLTSANNNAEGYANNAQSNAVSSAKSYTDGQISTVNNSISSVQTTANGKNTIYYQTAQPSGGTYKTGDLWFDTDDGYKMYGYNGSTWVSSQFGTDAIANASITNALIADATIQSGKIANLDAGKITTGVLDANRIASNSITTDKLLIGDFTNYCPNSTFENGSTASWDGLAGTSYGNSSSPTKYYAQQNSRDALCGQWIPVQPGDQFYVSMFCWTDAFAHSFDIGFFMQDKNYSNTQYYGVASNTDGVKKTISGTVTIPTGIAYIKIWTLISATSGFENWYFTNVIVRKVTPSVLIQDGAITTSKITSNAITADKIATNTITATQIASNTITSTQIASRTITAGNLVAGTITANEIASNTITGNKIQANTITAGNLVAGTLTSASGVFGTVDANILTTGTLDANRIGAKTIDATKLVAGCITSASGVVGALDAGTITTGTLNANRIASNSITTDKLLIGDGTNLAVCNENTGAVTNNPYSTDTISGGYITRTDNSSAFFMVTSKTVLPFEPNEQLYFEFYALSDVAVSCQFGVWVYTAQDSNLTNTSNGFTINTTENKISGYVTVPNFDSTQYIKFVAGLQGVNGRVIKLRKIFLRRVTGGTLIQDGAITTSKIVSSAITTDKIAAGAVQASNILSNTITATQIASGTITATQIASRTITADRIVANAITSNEIASHTITANNILANTITAGQIASNTITSTQIASGTITAGNIASGTITSSSACIGSLNANWLTTGTLNANLVNVTNLNASNITSGTMSANHISGGTLTLGGGSNGNGVSIVNNSAGKEIVRQDNNGLTITMQQNGDYLNNAFKIQAYTGQTLMNIDDSGTLYYYGVMELQSLIDSTKNLTFDPNGTISLNGGNSGRNAFGLGTGDGANFSTYDMELSCWWGLAFGSSAPYDGTNAYKPKIIFDCRSGDITTQGNYKFNDGKYATPTDNVNYFGWTGSFLACNTNGGPNLGINTWQSDISLKRNVKDSTEDALNKLCSIPMRQFDWKDGRGHQKLGLVSQEAMQIDPAFAFGVTQPDGSKIYQPDETILIPYVLKAIQQLNNHDSALEQRIATLEATVKDQQDLITELQNKIPA